MEEHREELDEAGYQLMMDVFNRSMDDTPPPSRWWKGLAILLVVLGGGAGLLLAIGNRTHETPDSRRTLASTSQSPAFQLQVKGFQERTNFLIPAGVSQEETRLPETPEEDSRPAVIQPAPGSQAGRGTRGVSASTTTSPPPKASRARPSLMSKSKQGCACPETDRLARVARQRSIQPSQRSLHDEFDPNAALVRSTP
jgi:hypothetical protein